MSQLDLAAIFGQPEKAKADPRVSIALLLKHLSDLPGAEEEEEESSGSIPQIIEPIPVRARVEPLGG